MNIRSMKPFIPEKFAEELGPLLNAHAFQLFIVVEFHVTPKSIVCKQPVICTVRTSIDAGRWV